MGEGATRADAVCDSGMLSGQSQERRVQSRRDKAEHAAHAVAAAVPPQAKDVLRCSSGTAPASRASAARRDRARAESEGRARVQCCARHWSKRTRIAMGIRHTAYRSRARSGRRRRCDAELQRPAVLSAATTGLHNIIQKTRDSFPLTKTCTNLPPTYYVFDLRDFVYVVT